MMRFMRLPRTHRASNTSTAASRLESDTFRTRCEAETAGDCGYATGRQRDIAVTRQETRRKKKGSVYAPFWYRGCGSYLLVIPFLFSLRPSYLRLLSLRSVPHYIAQHLVSPFVVD